MTMKLKPIAKRLSQWGSATEVIYSCPKCGCSFGFYSTDEHFCHNCGQEIDWNVIIKVNEKWKKEYHGCDDLQKQKEMMKKIDGLNQRYAFGSPVEMIESEADEYK